MYGGKRGVLVNAENLCAASAARPTPQLPRPRQPRLGLQPELEAECGKRKKKGRGRTMRISDARRRLLACVLLAGARDPRCSHASAYRAPLLSERSRTAEELAADAARPLLPPEGQIEGACGLAVAPAAQTLRLRLLPPVIDVFTPRRHLPELATSSPAATRVFGRSTNSMPSAASPSTRPATSTATNSTRRVLRLPGEAVDRPGRIDRGRRRRRRQPLRRRPHLRRRLRRAGRTGRGAGAKIGLGNLGDAYGVAVDSERAASTFADAANDTVKVFEPAVDPAEPVGKIDGPPGAASAR